MSEYQYYEFQAIDRTLIRSVSVWPMLGWIGKLPDRWRGSVVPVTEASAGRDYNDRCDD